MDTIAYLAVSASFFGLILTVFSARFRELLKIKNKKAVALACGVVLVVSLVLAPRTDTEAPVATEPTPTITVTATNTPVPVVFDIPSLFGQNIDGVRVTLGTPTNSTLEPTALQLSVGVDEWDNTFIKGNVSLLVTFNPNTREVIDYFISPNDGQCDPAMLKTVGGVSGSVDATLKVVNVISDPTQCTGVIVTPN